MKLLWEVLDRLNEVSVQTDTVNYLPPGAIDAVTSTVYAGLFMMENVAAKNKAEADKKR